MSDSVPFFPEPFRDLERFKAWSLPTEAQRNAKRYQSTMEELQVLYEMLSARAEAVFAVLDRTPLAQLSGPERRLFHLMLSLAEVAYAVENYEEAAPPYLMRIDRFVPVKTYPGTVRVRN